MTGIIADKIYGHLNDIRYQKSRKDARKGQEKTMTYSILIEQFLEKLSPEK